MQGFVCLCVLKTIGTEMTPNQHHTTCCQENCYMFPDMFRDVGLQKMTSGLGDLKTHFQSVIQDPGSCSHIPFHHSCLSAH